MKTSNALQATIETHLTWANVALAFAFIIFDAILSLAFRLGVGSALVTAALRCIIQLAVMGGVLTAVFKTENPWAVAGISILLNLLAAFEAVVNKSKRRFDHMFPSVIIAMGTSTIPVSIIGSRFAMSVDPFWSPHQYIPIVGMLCGSTVSGIVVAVSYVLKEIEENRDKVEMYLAFGATRFEAGAPIAKEALKLALTPCVNQMSIIGIITIPGMMTGAILGGSSVEQAAKMQMIIMFMISASTALAIIVAVGFSLSIVMDDEHRLRGDRIDSRKHALWRGRDRVVGWGAEKAKATGKSLLACVQGKGAEAGGERERLLPSSASTE